MSNVSNMPPGSSMFFGQQYQDNIFSSDGGGNVSYSGGASIDEYPPAIYEQAEEVSGPMPEEGQAVSYASAPSTRVLPTAPPPPDPPGSRVFSEVIREGIRVQAGDLKRFSQEIMPATIEGWVNPEFAEGSDNNRATHNAAGGGYSDELILKDFDVALPAGARIVGIKVTVERSKV